MRDRTKRTLQLGGSIGKVNNQLKKALLFSFVKKLNLDSCFQCKKKIEDINDFSIEHKVPWLDSENPIELFLDLNNIAFSHFKCNSGAARNYSKEKGLKHPSLSAYNKRGCRCCECRELSRVRMEKYRRTKK